MLAGAGVATLALQPLLAPRAEARRTPGVPLQPWVLPPEAPATAVEQARALISAAVLAGSHWNAQPWRFEVEGASLRLLLDPQRTLPVTDPDQRASLMGLGAALEHVLVAARAWGLRTTVRAFPADRPHHTVAEVGWTPGEPRRDRTLFPAIVERRTNRRDYDGRAILMEHAAQLAMQASDGFHLHWADDRGTLHALADAAHDATRARVMDRRAEAECWAWVRTDDDDVRRGDGISTEALGLSGPVRWFATRWFDARGHFLRVGAGSLAHTVRDAVRSSGALAVLGASGRGESAWLTAGQVYARFALKATQLGLAYQPLDVLVSHAPARAELAGRLGLGGDEPLMAFRIGHAQPVPATPRRAVSLVASFRTS
ncbi:MAG TPA: hypothetical protein VFK69_11040 [Candidatus Eisenbacteria bacterium]|nr:hypothetical protein [Candidatus Eisenbacteria bacterium]